MMWFLIRNTEELCTGSIMINYFQNIIYITPKGYAIESLLHLFGFYFYITLKGYALELLLKVIPL
jgi:hypothetical protein